MDERNSTPQVSVIIATYNRAHLIRQAVETVLAQTIPDIEVIIIDDGSSDGTREAVLEMQEARVRYRRHDCNRGLPAARNTGIALATGAFIAFLDDDDRWMPDKLETQLAQIERYDGIVCGYRTTSGRSGWKLAGGRIDRAILCRGNFFPPSGLFGRAEIFRQVPFDEALPHALGEDWDALIRLSEKFRIGYFPDPLIVYDDRLTDRMTSPIGQIDEAVLEPRLAVLRKHRAYLGPFWFRFHVADIVLGYLAYRRNPLQSVAYALRRCGILPVVRVLARKVWRRFYIVPSLAT